jgi:hypothetical protein
MACAVPGSGETNGGAQLGVDEEPEDSAATGSGVGVGVGVGVTYTV